MPLHQDESFASQVKEQLEPLFQSVLEALSDGGDPMAFAFFMERNLELKAADTEAGVLEMFVHLSQAAFLGAQYTEDEWRKIDELLAQAEGVSAAMTAQGMH